MFTHYDVNDENPITELTDQNKMDITDLAVQDKTPTQIKHELLLPTALIKNSINIKKLIEVRVINLMKGEVVVTPEERDEGGNITQVAVYNDIPVNLDGLKTEAKKAFPHCSETPFNYNIDKIIEYSKKDGSGDWTFFSGVF